MSDLDPSLNNRKLTPRERQVVELVAQGLSSKEAAEKLGLSPVTVTQHIESARSKLGARNRVQLIFEAIQNGEVEVPPVED